MKRIFAILVFIAAIVGGAFFMGFFPANPTKTHPNPASTEMVEQAAPAMIGLEKGKAAPDFELFTPTGERVTLSQFRGKKVLLNFWATWCPPCRAEMPDVEKFYSQHKDEVVVLAVNLTGTEKVPEKVPQFIKEFGLTFPVVLDKQNQVADRYWVSAIPTSYLLDAQGVIQQKVVGQMNAGMLEKAFNAMP